VQVIDIQVTVDVSKKYRTLGTLRPAPGPSINVSSSSHLDTTV